MYASEMICVLDIVWVSVQCAVPESLYTSPQYEQGVLPGLLILFLSLISLLIILNLEFLDAVGKK